MPINQDFPEIERMYRSCVQGIHAPTLSAISGTMILSMLRLDDERRAGIDPVRFYLVSPERLTVVADVED